jgi:D-alanyl-lipoteichoic acid acyltransferase DltB (MBOAT superfamily)
MQLTSISFFLFTVTVFLLFFLTPRQLRWVVLLVAGIFFYATWNTEYLVFLIASVGFNFYVGRKLDKERRKSLVFFGISANLLALLIFKYVSLLFPSSSLKPPIGISFYTLQMIAYLSDVYNNVQKSETHFSRFSIFATFFPLQVSGPIERAKNLLPQLSNGPEFDPINAREGLQRIGWGVFKKLVIADRLAIYVDRVFNTPTEFYGLSVILAVIFFAFQLYCDFSGYTDIVVGVARLLGYRIAENFKNPYFSNSIQKFWNTWHISLSTWLRDYIFFPLRRNLMRQKNMPTILTIIIPPFITMFISGLWHGEGWNYLLWGILHGGYLIIENLIRPIIDPFFEKGRSELVAWSYQKLSIFFTFILICFGWLFFRAKSTADAFLLLKNIFKLDLYNYISSFSSEGLDAFLRPFIFDGGLNKENFLLSIFLIVFLLIIEYFGEKNNLIEKFNMLPVPLRWLFYVVGVFGIVMFSTDSSTQNFIYFNF